MGQDKEEYEVGIPLDDLSASAEPLETDPAETKNDDAAARPEDDEGVGLPSLFDEDELAEVGLKAAPFEDDGDFMVEAPDPPEGGPDTEEGLFPDEPPEPIASDVTPGDGLEEPASIGELNPTVDDGEPVQEDRETPDFQEQESLEEKVGPLIGETETPPTLQHEIGTIHSLLTELKEEFVGKLKYDTHKDKIIDKLHQELQEYKQDIVKKHILSIVLDVVKVADDIRKWLTYFRSLDVSQRDPVKLFRYLEAIPSDLEDIFYWQGVRPYTNKGGIFNPAKQRAIKKIPTDDRSRDKTIAKSLRPGYEWEDKVIRQEMVAVYVYEDETESVDTRNIDE
jgi:molecular chaperone GrpE (heat shock protein)